MIRIELKDGNPVWLNPHWIEAITEREGGSDVWIRNEARVHSHYISSEPPRAIVDRINALT